jgi:hypothetical protein
MVCFKKKFFFIHFNKKTENFATLVYSKRLLTRKVLFNLINVRFFCMKLVLKFFCILVLFLFVFGCVENNQAIENQYDIIEEEVNVDSLMEIISNDKDYESFSNIYPDFEPILVEYYSLTLEDYVVLRDDWNNSFEMRHYIPIFDDLKLNENTFFVELKNANSNNGLIAVLDMEKKVSLKIISVIVMLVGGEI